MSSHHLLLQPFAISWRHSCFNRHFWTLSSDITNYVTVDVIMAIAVLATLKNSDWLIGYFTCKPGLVGCPQSALGCIHIDTCTGTFPNIGYSYDWSSIEWSVHSHSYKQPLVIQMPLKIWWKLWNTFNFSQNCTPLSLVMYIAVDVKIASYLYYCINK